MKKITRIIQIFAVIFTLFALQSCREEAMPIAELNRTDVNSYSDLFNAFWDTMNNDYNYFNEQEESWDAVYRKYSPKFDALTTFNKADANPVVAEKEANLAFKYFAEIITGKTLDQHFGLNVTIPLPSITSSNRNSFIANSFSSNMKYIYTEEDGFLNLGRNSRNPSVNPRSANTVMRARLNPETVFAGGPLLAGFLNDDPETMYIQLTQFGVIGGTITESTFPLLKEINNLEGISATLYSTLKDLDANAGQQFETVFKNNLENFKTVITTILASNEYQNYLAAIENFRNTELVEDLEASIIPLAILTQTVKNAFYANHSNAFSMAVAYYTNPDTTPAQREAIDLLFGVYQNRLNTYKSVSGFTSSNNDFDTTLASLPTFLLDIYKKIYNPITNGTAKKIILDLRGNGGGAVIDARIFTERFITQPKVWGYQRTKEGNGRFNYSPWVPVETKPHQFGLKQNVPIAILIDENSFSMAEISTMMIKSQGSHVTILGDNSGGGTAGLGPQDAFNGGNLLNNGYLDFYMPLMAFKDSEGKIIESIGVSPDIKAIPTQEEVDMLRFTGIDPTFNAALEAIN